MPKPLKDITEQPSLTEDSGVVVPGLTAIKPSKAMKKYRPEKSSLAKLNMEEANVGEITTDTEEEKTAGAGIMIDTVAYLSGYCAKEAQAPVPIKKPAQTAPAKTKKGYGGGGKVGGKQLGTGRLSNIELRKMLDHLRGNRSMPAAAKHKMHKK